MPSAKEGDFTSPSLQVPPLCAADPQRLVASGKGGRATGGKVALEVGPRGNGGSALGKVSGRACPVGDKVAGLMGPGVQLGIPAAAGKVTASVGRGLMLGR